MNKIDLNALRDKAYKIACDHGFHDIELSNEHCLMLVITELSEAVEADRKLKYANRKVFEEIIKLPHRDYASKESIWSSHFETYIKDTIEDELSDAVIRLLDLAGLRNISIGLAMMDLNSDTIGDMAEACKDETFTESIYDISVLPERYKGLYDFSTAVNDMLLSIFGLAKHLNIDLMWHIEQKMKYNELREKMHGKKY